MALEKLRTRDGRLVDFDEDKIAGAITKAFDATYKPGQEATARKLTRDVVSILEVEGVDIPDVEHVQDIVERVLMDSGYVQTAKAYILYRNERSRAREMNTRLMKVYEDITFSGGADSSTGAGTAMAAMLKYGSEGAKQFYQMFVLKPEHAKAHREGDIHIHDLAFYTLTTDCCQIDLQKLLDTGLSAGRGSLPAPDGIADCAVLAATAIQAGQNDQHGGQSIANFDYAMAGGVARTFASSYTRNPSRCLALLCGPEQPEVELVRLRCAIARETGLLPRLGNCRDYLEAELPRLTGTSGGADLVKTCQEQAVRWAEAETEEAARRAMETFIRTLNTVESRAGAQLPRSAIHYGCDTSPEGRLATRSVLLAADSCAGSQFPVQIFRVKEGVNYSPGDPNYDLLQLACRCAARGLPIRFAFLDAPFNRQYHDPGRPETEIAYTDGRARVISNIHDPSRQQCGGRGNLSSTSVNLPRIAIKAKGDLDQFFDELDNKMNLCIQQLTDRLEIQSQKRVCNYPFLMGQGVWLDSGKLRWNDEVREVLKHGALSMGFVGLAEALVALTGKHHGESEHSQRLGLEIVARMRARMDEECQKTGLNFSLLAPPAEDLGGRLAAMDRRRFGEIPGVTDHGAYTDSFHLPNCCPLSAAQRIQREAPYHALTNGGHITCVVLEGGPEAPDALEAVVRAMKEAGIGCGSVTVRATGTAAEQGGTAGPQPG